jgi:hypothetical protein
MSTADHERLGYLRCNALGHAWFDVPSDWRTSFFGEQLTVRCERCGSERRDVLSGVTGELIYRVYVKPESYAYPKGMRPSRRMFRMMLLEQRIREAREARNR